MVLGFSTAGTLDFAKRQRWTDFAHQLSHLLILLSGINKNVLGGPHWESSIGRVFATSQE